MTVKLQVLHGKLQDSRGNAAGFVKVKGPVFVIGSDSDCSMCCRSKSVSPHHCEIRLQEHHVLVRDLFSDSGTFVNGERVDHERPLHAGDRLRVGRLEFTVVWEETTPVSRDAGSPPPRPRDSIAEFISDLLIEEDERERTRRLHDPAQRQFRAASAPPEPKAAGPAPVAPEGDAPKKQVRPEKKPPAKLPPPPSITAESSVAAAEETLNKIFFKGRR